jgi:hypothetical protein
MGTRMNLKTSFVLHFSPCSVSALYQGWSSISSRCKGVYRCSLGLVFNANACQPRLVITRWHDFASLFFGSWHRYWPMPRCDCWRSFHTQNYDGTSRIPWAFHKHTHFFHHKNQTTLGKSHVECGVLISQNQAHTIPRFDSWAPTQTTNNEGMSNSSFGVSYQIQGLWQYVAEPPKLTHF